MGTCMQWMKIRLFIFSLKITPWGDGIKRNDPAILVEIKTNERPLKKRLRKSPGYVKHIYLFRPAIRDIWSQDFTEKI